MNTLPTIFSYVIARDFGFAPNPFHGYCTLACCKPKIRDSASLGDWVIGTGSKSYGLSCKLVYAMKVSEVLSFQQYWSDPRFITKRPNIRGSYKWAYGDNIYHKNPHSGRWVQEDSHHSHEGGKHNLRNIVHDTKIDRVLIAEEFWYWGGKARYIPRQFLAAEENICKTGQGHRNRFSDGLVRRFIAWVTTLPDKGFIGAPAEYSKIRAFMRH